MSLWIHVSMGVMQEIFRLFLKMSLQQLELNSKSTN